MMMMTDDEAYFDVTERPVTCPSKTNSDNSWPDALWNKQVKIAFDDGQTCMDRPRKVYRTKCCRSIFLFFLLQISILSLTDYPLLFGLRVPIKVFCLVLGLFLVQHVNHHLGNCRTTVLLLTRHQVAIRNGKRGKGCGDTKCRVGQLAGLVLNAVGLNLESHGRIGDIFFGIGKASPGFAVDNEFDGIIIIIISCRQFWLPTGAWSPNECGCAPDGTETFGLAAPTGSCTVNGTCPHLCADAGFENARNLCRSFPGDIEWWEGNNVFNQSLIIPGAFKGDFELEIYIKEE